MDKFCSTGGVADLDRSGRPSHVEERVPVVQQIVSQHSGRISTTAISHESAIPISSVPHILSQQLKFHPYGIQLVHALAAIDKQARIDSNYST